MTSAVRTAIPDKGGRALKTKKIPVRMCIACREGRPKKELVRIVSVEGDLIPDDTGKAHGRGAYLCPDVNCLDRARKIRAFDRALETPMTEEAYNAIKRVILRRDIIK
jgi:predicted RNA-binding protein YlxR (DUF448 family)